MAIPGRRPKGSRTSAVPLYLQIDPEAKALIDRMAAATGTPKWLVLESILDRVELDEHGRPVWWSSPTPGQEELPLQQAG